MLNIKKHYPIMLTAVLCCCIMGYVDGVLKPDYWIKSIIKIILFGIIFVIYLIKNNQGHIINMLYSFNKSTMLKSLAYGLGIYFLILICYFTIGRLFDFSQIVPSLESNGNINKQNFIFVSLYISFINSMLEEFFFRGICFIYLSNYIKVKFAYCFSSLLFSIYHISIIANWFSLELLLLLIFALFAVGYFFCFINYGSKSIYKSWFLHMFANLSINTIGFLLFGII